MKLGQTCRSLVRSPGFAALVVLTLATGIGATTAMFSIADAVIFRPLRFPGAGRAAEIWIRTSEGAGAQPGLTGTAFAHVKHGLGDISSVEGYQFGTGTISGGVEPIVVPTPSVTPGLLHLTGATPIIGRLFVPEDAAPGATSALISEQMWTSHFGRDPTVAGRRITVDGEPRTIVGVLSRRARYPEARAAVWMPLDMSVAGKSRRRIQTVVVRHPGVSTEQLRARLDSTVLTARDAGVLAVGQSLLLDDVVQIRVSRTNGQPLWLMLGAVGLVLMVACVNVMNLLLVRTASRRGELAVLSAVGASRAQLVRHAALEVIALALIGSLAGMLLAGVLIRATPALLPQQLYYLVSTPPELNWLAVAFASAIAATVCLLAGLLPMWRASRVDPLDAMQRQARSLAGAHDERWQGAMLAVQIGTIVVLLCGTGLLLRSFTRLTNVDPGFDADALTSVSFDLSGSRYREAGVALATAQDLQRRVEDAGLGPGALTAGTPIAFEIRPEGEGGRPVDAAGMVLPWFPVSHGYFETMGIPIIQGRGFAPDDGADVIVVNDRLARTFWGEESPLGRRFRLDADQPWRMVVGVVGDVRALGLDDPTGHGMEFYTTHSRTRAGGSYNLMVRSPLPSAAVVQRVKELLWATDPDVPVTDAGSFRDALLDSLYRQRFILRLSSIFSAIALLLAGVGIYGVAAYQVARRRRDLAVRVALGATGRHVLALMLSRAAAVGAAGGVLGIAGTVAAVRWLRSSLFETGAADPLVLVGTIAITACLIVVACLVPARAAIAADPAVALREP